MGRFRVNNAMGWLLTYIRRNEAKERRQWFVGMLLFYTSIRSISIGCCVGDQDPHVREVRFPKSASPRTRTTSLSAGVCFRSTLSRIFSIISIETSDSAQKNWIKFLPISRHISFGFFSRGYVVVLVDDDPRPNHMQNHKPTPPVSLGDGL